ncbi:MAG: LLM class flavin-dependent oxidoreductase [Rhodospirillaceae bacterium]|jgi:F420-dependent oxidoreductase-like protein|nr:LLM class flavin-dependent oxidoreductase [Rhodospirillaceae bacterium]MBT4046161.1 LLM class flavin-dependent oxidoreductase [Rhodospirillaceae bacterium]MBT4690195.1 LLM class flavin-dependent oxidoreductase [Rhodospirillaceae bacterium]MBT5080760.1 LLM class flavin-dependent oxidoreductase [Rhodospirillaceae bacterium]MBT5525182.1 LLM class flavin-dependent oxidoreductase [Rhodospirillaceae bacterium]
MKVSISIGAYKHVDVPGIVEIIQQAEKLGVEYAWSSEAWGHDAVTSLAYLGALTDKIKLGSGIMQISARTPSMTAMTALSLDDLTNGRFILGLGVSGPQVVEGLHGSAYKAPLSRLRETVEILRMAFRGEKLRYDGDYHVLPRPGGEGKALRLDHPPRDIPIYLATLGPKSLEYTGAAADGWLGTSFSPDHAEAHLAHLRKGAESAGRTLADIDLHASCNVSVGEDVEALIDARRGGVAFSMGAMGSEKTNFYNDAFKRAGFTDDALAIQRLWKDGKRREAAERVPDAMVTDFGAIGTADMVRDRFKVYRDAGINALTLRLESQQSNAAQIANLEQVMDLLPEQN